MILDNWLTILDMLLIFGDVERKHKKKRGIILWARRLVVERIHFWLNIFRQLIYFEKKRFLAIPYFYTVTIAQTIIEK